MCAPEALFGFTCCPPNEQKASELITYFDGASRRSEHRLLGWAGLGVKYLRVENDLDLSLIFLFRMIGHGGWASVHGTTVAMSAPPLPPYTSRGELSPTCYTFSSCWGPRKTAL